MANKKSEESFFKKYGMFLIIIGLLVVFLIIMLVTGGDKKNKSTTKGEVKTIDVSEWVDNTKKDDIMVTVFAQTTCSWCEKFKPVAEEVIKDENVEIYWFDIDNISQEDYASLGKAYSDLKEFGTPYTIITRNGKKIDEISGYVEKKDLIAKLKKVGVIK